jgi:hypothetical protein
MNRDPGGQQRRGRAQQAVRLLAEADDRRRKPEQREPDDGKRQRLGDEDAAADAAMVAVPREPRPKASREQHGEQQREADDPDLDGDVEHEHVRAQPPVDGIPDRQQTVDREQIFHLRELRRLR